MILDCGCIVSEGQIDGACETHGLGETLRTELERFRTGVETLRTLVQRLPDADYGEQETTAKAIKQTIRELQHPEGD